MPLLPELLLTGAALLLLLLDSDRPGRKAWLLLLTFAALVGAAVCVSTTACGGATTCCPTGAGMVKTPMFQGMVDITPVTTVLRALLLIGVALIVALSAGFEGFQRPRFAWGTYLGLLLLSTVGLFLLVAATDLMMILIAIELVSVTSFVLTAIVKDDRRSSEAALKYFLVGAFSAGLMIYGFSLLYGITGTTNVAKLMTSETTWPLLPMMGAWMFVLAGFGFKLALVPFHMWAPDVYEGAPTPVTAFLSVAPKTAAFGMLLRFFSQSDFFHLTPLLAVISAVTMTLGNLGALRQTNVKRLLAYSSIAQMGYVLMGLVAAGPAGPRSVVVYLSAYLFMNLGAFTIALLIAQDSKTESIEGFNGLVGRSLPLALVTTVFLLSLTGIPPLVGFIGKFSIFSAVLQTPGLWWLAVVGALNSVVSFAYYFSIARAIFFGTTDRRVPVALTPLFTGCLGLTFLVTVAAGLFPNALLTLVQRTLP